MKLLIFLRRERKLLIILRRVRKLSTLTLSTLRSDWKLLLFFKEETLKLWGGSFLKEGEETVNFPEEGEETVHINSIFDVGNSKFSGMERKLLIFRVGIGERKLVFLKKS